MTIEELKNFLIKRGIEGVKKTETGSKQLGGLEGFEMCRELKAPKDFENKIDALHKESKEIFMRRPDVTTEEQELYWRIRHQCLQVEFVYERLKCAWRLPLLSARAALDYSKILDNEVNPQKSEEMKAKPLRREEDMMDKMIEKYFGLDSKVIYFHPADIIAAEHHLSYHRRGKDIILTVGSDEGEVNIGLFWVPEELEHCIKHFIYNAWRP